MVALIKDDAVTLALWREAIAARPGHKANSDNVTIKPKRGNSKSGITRTLGAAKFFGDASPEHQNGGRKK